MRSAAYKLELTTHTLPLEAGHKMNAVVEMRFDGDDVDSDLI